MDKFEIVEFYPVEFYSKKLRILGNVHIYLEDLGIDIRGVVIRKQGKSFWVELPYLWAFDQGTGKKVRYPSFSFLDAKRTKDLVCKIQEQIGGFLKVWFDERQYINDEFLENLRKEAFRIPKSNEENLDLPKSD